MNLFRRDGTILIPALLVMAQMAFLGYQLASQRWLLADSHEYILASENLFEAGTLYCGDLNDSFRTDYLTKRPPLYPILLGLIPTFPLILTLQALLGLFNLWLAWRLVSLAFPRANRLSYGVLVLLSPALFIYPLLVMTEVWLQSLLILACWGVMQYRKRGSHSGLWLASLALGMSVWLKPVTFPLAIIWFLVLGIMSWVTSRKIFPGLVPGLLPLLFVGVLGGINQARTGVFHVSSITSINILQYNAYYTQVRAIGQEAAKTWVDGVVAKAEAADSYAQRRQIIQDASAGAITANLGAYLSLHLRGMLHFFVDPGRFDLYHFFDWQSETGKDTGLLARYSESGYAGIWQYLREQGLLPLLALGLSFLGRVAILAGVVLAIWKYRRRPAILVLFLMIPLYLALATGPLGASRFAVPVLPLLIGVAAAGFTRTS